MKRGQQSNQRSIFWWMKLNGHRLGFLVLRGRRCVLQPSPSFWMIKLAYTHFPQIYWTPFQGLLRTQLQSANDETDKKRWGTTQPLFTSMLHGNYGFISFSSLFLMVAIPFHEQLTISKVSLRYLKLKSLDVIWCGTII